MSKVKTVPKRLSDLGNLYAERNKLYGDNYKRFGETLMSHFPDGIELKNSDDFNRFALFCQVMHKLSRYARAMPSSGHSDSLNDLSVYAQMLGEWDDERSV